MGPQDAARDQVRVDYDAESQTALAVYVDQPIASSKVSAGEADAALYDGFYKSSDDKMLAGVCAGLAHKWKFSCLNQDLISQAVSGHIGALRSQFAKSGHSSNVPARPSRGGARVTNDSGVVRLARA